MFSPLHTSFTFANGVKTKNRFALAPMTSSQSLSNGHLSAEEFLWLKQCAQGGFGIVLTCAAHISLEGQGWHNELGIFHDSLLSELQVLTRTIKIYHALPIMQIYHGGLRSPAEVLGHAPLNLNHFSQEKIHQIIEEFGDAAERAEKAGFSGIEIHGANGYLITQFISTQTNQRTDEYGGSLNNRARFLLEVVKNCQQKVSSEFLVGVRISPENFGNQTGLKKEENIQIAKWLEKHGVSYLHISTWDALKPHLITDFRSALQSLPILIAGGVQSPQNCLDVLNAGADIVALGKIALGNPYFPVKSKNKYYQPNLPPYDESYLEEGMISTAFRKVLKNFNGFMK